MRLAELGHPDSISLQDRSRLLGAIVHTLKADQLRRLTQPIRQMQKVAIGREDCKAFSLRILPNHDIFGFWRKTYHLGVSGTGE